MADNFSISDDPGTILESYHSSPKPVASAARPSPNAWNRPSAPPVEEVLYRSQYRWPAPTILICNDGTLDAGETVYVRSEKISIGRTKGELTFGHDIAMSSAHAQIAREDIGGKQDWVLRDLESSNGTFVRSRNVTLRPGIVIQLGSKRFRFEAPAAGTLGMPAATDPGTALLSDFKAWHADALPAFTECVPAGATAAARYPIRTTRATIGRPNCGNDIAIDDLCVGSLHAVVTRDVSGVWQLEAHPTLNGVWVKIDAIRLIDNCLFQCGEQRFRFRTA